MSLKRRLARWLILITLHQLVWSSTTSMLMKKMVILLIIQDELMIVTCLIPLDAGHIVVDVCALEDGSIAEITLDTLNQNYPETLKPKSRRYVLPLASGNVVC